MFTFHSIMFVSLGFLCALLLGFVVAPAFWARAVRLTTARMRASLPLSEQEISAERDRLRAENAIRVHQLTSKIEQARLYDARQKVEINRRDGMINSLQRRLQEIETEREGSENARRVLEATITQRVPEIEARLMEARQLLANRDAEMKALQNDTGRTFRALDEAMQVNAQQRAEIDRLKMSMASHGRRSQAAVPGAETDTALRTELESLRLRSRDQSALIDKLRRELRGARAASAEAREKRTGDAAKDVAGAHISFQPASAGSGDGDLGNSSNEERDGLQKRIAEADTLRAELAEQIAKVDALTAQLAAYEEDAASQGKSISLRDSRTALKARVASSEKQLEARDKLIEELRRELVTANERLARQASHYQEELRRLGGSGKSGRSQPEASDKSGRGDRALAAASSYRGGAGTGDKLGATPVRQASTAVAGEKASVNGDATSSSLEARLSAAEASAGEIDADDDQRDVAAEAGAKRPRGKLMDRIADLAKR